MGDFYGSSQPQANNEINEYGRETIELFKLETSPLTVALVPEGAEVPENVEGIEKEMKPHQMVYSV